MVSVEPVVDGQQASSHSGSSTMRGVDEKFAGRDARLTVVASADSVLAAAVVSASFVANCGLLGLGTRGVHSVFRRRLGPSLTLVWVWH